MSAKRNKRNWLLGILVVILAMIAVGQVFEWWWGASTPPDRRLISSARADGDAKEHKHTNHLIKETSPYLLQHAHNPVNWYAWGPEALEKAKKENKPIFLSVGYSTCYWCHVMEKQSFEDEEVAKVLNEHFVAIKVDREERPDIDEQYMIATQLVTGRGGWPNSVWLTPDGRPWMAGTYFPKEQFMQVLTTLAGFWKNRHDEVEQQADQLAAAIKRFGAGLAEAGAERPITRELVGNGVTQTVGVFDAARGGFDGAPKFPPHGALRLLLDEAARSKDPALLRPITKTLDAMWLGGMHDHIGGGFHRYATDAIWLLPHFEKMLYDNAQLMRSYTDGYLLTKTPRYHRAVEDIYAWVSREMTDEGGAFYSALDSGEVDKEGETYVWHHKEALEVLGEADGKLFAEVYNIKPLGNFREEATGESTGTNIVYLTRPLRAIAEERQEDPDAFIARMAGLRAKLLARRNTWVQPHKDDKVLTSWNGLMIGSLAYAGRRLDEPKYIDAAAKAADFLLTTLSDKDGRLLRTYRAEEAKLPGYLDDYAYLAEGLIELHRATGEKRWLDAAARLGDIMIADFADPVDGGFFFTAASHDNLLMRSKSLMGGGNVPTANGVAALVMTDLAALTGETRYADATEATLKALSGVMAQQPRAVESVVVAAGHWLEHKDTIAKAVAAKAPVAGAPTIGESPAAEPQPVAIDTADAGVQHAPISVGAFVSHLTAKPGQTIHVAVAIDVADGWHLYGPNPEADFLIPTSVAIEAPAGVTVGDARRPQPKRKTDPILKQKLATYEGRIWFVVPVTVNDDAGEGAVALTLTVKTQACDAARCLPPRSDTLRLPVVIAGDAPDAAPRHGKVFKPLLESGHGSDPSTNPESKGTRP